MKTKTIKLYEYQELSKEAKAKALSDYNEHFDGYALQVDLDNAIETELEKHGIKPEDSSHAKIQYSLSNSQGDGVMFEGRFEWKDYLVDIKQSGHYTHSHSKTIDIYRADDMEPLSDVMTDAEAEKVYSEFENIYQSICSVLEKQGYEIIEDMQSEAYFIEACNANEYTFREDGTLETA